MAKTRWVLRDAVSGLLFRRMTGIGPECTEDMALAATFATEQSAMQSPAYPFAFAAFNPEKCVRALSPGAATTESEAAHEPT